MNVLHGSLNIRIDCSIFCKLLLYVSDLLRILKEKEN